MEAVANNEIAELKAKVERLESLNGQLINLQRETKWELEKANESNKRLRRVAFRYMRMNHVPERSFSEGEIS